MDDLVEQPAAAAAEERPKRLLEGRTGDAAASIEILAETAQFDYAFDEREAFGVCVRMHIPPGPGDLTVQIMYFGDDIGDWQLLYETLNPPAGSRCVWVTRPHSISNKTNYKVKAGLIGKTTVEASATITPRYSRGGNGTVTVRGPKGP